MNNFYSTISTFYHDVFKTKRSSASKLANKKQEFTDLEADEMVDRSNKKKLKKTKYYRKKKHRKSFENSQSQSASSSSTISKEPGTVTAIVPFTDYSTNTDYKELVKHVKKDNEKINVFKIKCNSTCKAGDLIVDKNRKVTFILKNSPLMNLLLYEDEILCIDDNYLDNGTDDRSLPVETLLHLNMMIKRRGRSFAVPLVRQQNINLNMEYGYYYFVVTVPRFKNHAIGIEFHDTIDDGIIIRNVIENTVGYYLFSQGDYICDINGILLLTAEQAFKMINEDETTFPEFTCIIKRSSIRATQLKTIRNLFEVPHAVMRNDVINIARKEEARIVKESSKSKKKPRSVLKKSSTDSLTDLEKLKIIPNSASISKSISSNMLGLQSPIRDKKDPTLKISDTPKTHEVESDIENLVFTNPVPKIMTPEERAL
uniref:PDZ domain-containing protein n=1 Tax=Parastrongyloides trichosuri TaxID=131310 RepID=A0A0N4ZXZ8_PARTI